MNPLEDPAHVATPSELAEQAASEYRRRFGGEPAVRAAAPARVNLIGEHVDYNDGFVLPMALERYCVIGAGPAPESEAGTARCYSLQMDSEATFSVDKATEPSGSGWATYLEGVVAGFLERGFSVPAFNAVLTSNVPLGGGLSSSAALEVVMATTIEGLCGKDLGLAEKALLCQEAEHRYAGVPCGIMDQFSSVFGRADELMLLDCRSQQIEPVPFVSQDVSVLIINSNVKHELTGGEYAERRQQCESALKKLGLASWRDADLERLESSRGDLTEVEYRRAKHVVTEIARTTKTAAAVREGAWSRAGSLMYDSHDSMRDDFEISCAEIDALVEIAADLGEGQGVFGSRMTGGGFGGCTVSLVRSDRAEQLIEQILAQYEKKTGKRAEAFSSRPARGAHLL